MSNADREEVFRGYVKDGARDLGEEMREEQWFSIGSEDRDHLFWMHPPSQRCISVEGPVPRRTENYDCLSIPPLHEEPADPATLGYLVLCRRHDEHGNPYEGQGFWVESFGEAIRRARTVRASILAEHPPIAPREQLTLDDALSRKKVSE